MDSKHITILVDNDSWITPYAERLIQALRELKYVANLVRNAEAIEYGWINFMLGCTHIVSEKILSRNQHNLVVHESDLPKGRGFAPMSWQILEGNNNIPVCLLEAESETDAGDIWIRDSIRLDGTELCDEWRVLQGEKTIELCIRFVSEYKNLSRERQAGTPSNFRRRHPIDSRLEVNKTLVEQFNLLRIVDNIRYPGYFEIDNQRYIITINKAANDDPNQ